MTERTASKKVQQAKQDLIFESLAVKYRPKRIADLVGQDHIATQFTGMLKKGRIPHGILVSGESGVGKTTVSRMIAGYVNCQTPNEDYSPCGTCISCKHGKEHPDLMEVNAADSRGIDDVRALIQSAKNMPTMGKHKIILLDEVHMFTVQAFNALLKSLEEPPARTLWILSTTNPEKIPKTIIGRCHNFSLKRISEDMLVRRIYKIAKLEGVDFKTDIEGGVAVLKAIAGLAGGQMRDSISMLENALFAINSGDAIDVKTLIEKYVTTNEADVEKAAAEILISILKANHLALIRGIRGGGEARAILSKLRWLLQYLIDNAVGLAKYAPYSGRLFAKLSKDEGVKVSIPALLDLQYRLVEIERTFNTMSIDESVVMLSSLSSFALKFK